MIYHQRSSNVCVSNGGFKMAVIVVEKNWI
jgi:hypothetical protein